jgi:hypothetical protein
MGQRQLCLWPPNDECSYAESSWHADPLGAVCEGHFSRCHPRALTASSRIVLSTSKESAQWMSPQARQLTFQHRKRRLFEQRPWSSAFSVLATIHGSLYPIDHHNVGGQYCFLFGSPLARNGVSLHLYLHHWCTGWFIAGLVRTICSLLRWFMAGVCVCLGAQKNGATRPDETNRNR